MNISFLSIGCCIILTSSQLCGQKIGHLSEIDKYIIQHDITENILDYIVRFCPPHRLTNRLKKIDFSKRIKGKELLFEKEDSIWQYELPITIQEDPWEKNYYIIEVENWIMTNGKDTVAIPFSEKFDPSIKRFLFYYGNKKELLVSGQGILSDISMLSTPFRINELLKKRLYTYGISSVYPLEAYYNGVSRIEKDSIAWQWFLERHTEDLINGKIYIGRLSGDKVLLASAVIIIVKEEINNSSLNLGEIKLIYYKQSEIDIRIPNPSKISSDTPPSIKTSNSFDEIIIPINNYALYPNDVFVKKNQLNQEDFYMMSKGSDFIQFNIPFNGLKRR